MNALQDPGERPGDWPLSRTQAMACTPILVVGGSLASRRGLELLLLGEGYAVSTIPGGAGALEVIRREPPHLVVTDSAEFCRLLHTFRPDIPVILLTTCDEHESCPLAKRSGACGHLVKPIDFDSLATLVHEALGRRALASSKER